MAMWYYNTGNNPNSPVDGVIAIDIVGFETLLEGLGAVSVEGYNEVVTPENFRNVIYGIRAEGVAGTRQSNSQIPGNSAHKEFLAALYQSIFDEWQSFGDDPDRSAELLGSFLAAIQEKHVMFYFADNDLDQAVNNLGWSGAQSPAVDHDYIMIADANLGNKSNHSIFRQLTYDVSIQPEGALDSRLTISYDYPDRIATDDPAVDARYHGQLDYGNLLQVFVPYQSQIEDTDNLIQEPRVVDLPAHTLFVSRLRVDYDTSERFQFRYQTPAIVESIGPYQRYRLLVQKQPGTIADSVNVQVTLPPSARAIGIMPEPATSYDLERPILEFRLTLDKDQWVEIIYELNE